LASLVSPLAAAEVGVLALSTFDTDYLFVPRATAKRAVKAWTAAGHQVRL
jgi:hypothetical protein